MLSKMLSIIIVNFNTENLLRKCINSIFKANLNINFEVILIDNNSQDSSVPMCRVAFPSVHIIENKTNNMFAKANNQGIAIAKGEFFLFLNSDTVVKAGVLERLYSFIANKTNVAAVGPRLLNEDGSLQSQGYPLQPFLWTVVRNFSLDTFLPTAIKYRFFPWTNVNAATPMKTGWVSGACMVVSKVAIEKVGGGLCEELYFYGEEVEWCWRAKKAGMEVWRLPDVSILHYGGGLRTKTPLPRIYSGEENEWKARWFS